MCCQRYELANRLKYKYKYVIEINSLILNCTLSKYTTKYNTLYNSCTSTFLKRFLTQNFKNLFKYEVQKTS